MIKCIELNKEFNTKDEMFAALKANKEAIISLKKSTIKNSDPISYSFKHTTTKAEPKELKFGDSIYPVINTTNYYDSHGDVHIPGIWDKSAKEQNGKTYYIINHELEIGKVISYPKDVDIMVKSMWWDELGRDYAGQTQALIFRALLTEKSNEDAFKAFRGGEEIQNSIRMQYEKLFFCVDSDNEDYKEEKAMWEKYYPMIANKEDVDEVGYFWAVTEARIYKEGSAVLFGSNDATPVLYTEPKTEIVTEPVVTTQEQPKVFDLLKQLSIT